MSAILRGISVLVCLFMLAACEEEDVNSQPESVEAAAVAKGPFQLECERDGGRYGSVSGGLFACFQTLSDANKQCSAAGDCQGVCLARSRTCSPVKPLFGCHEVLSPGGLRQTECTE